MKKLFLSAVLTVVIAATSFAADVNKVNSKVVNNFYEQFYNVKNVNWTSTENYVKVSFTHDNKNIEAYYDLKDNMIGTSRNITIDHLPTNAKRSFAKKYAGYTVKEAIQFDGTEETAYYLSAENETQSMLLKVSDTGFLSVLKNVKK